MWICKEVCNNTEASEDLVLKIFHLSQTYWEVIVLLLVSRNSVLGDKNARDVLVWSLSEKLELEANNKLKEAKNLAKISQMLGVRAAWQEFGVLEKHELKEIIGDLLEFLLKSAK